MNEQELKQALKEYSEKLLRNADHREWMATKDPKTVMLSPEEFKAHAEALRLADRLLDDYFTSKGINFRE